MSKGKKTKKLKDIMVDFKDNKVFKIGFKRGSAFVFIGNKEQYEKEKESLSIRAKDAAEITLASSDKMIMSYISQVKQELSKIQGFVSRIEMAHRDNMDARVLRNVDLDDVEVIESYKSVDVSEKDSQIILVDGFASGNFWTVEEAERKRGRRESK